MQLRVAGFGASTQTYKNSFFYYRLYISYFTLDKIPGTLLSPFALFKGIGIRIVLVVSLSHGNTILVNYHVHIGNTYAKLSRMETQYS
jgi:hypothetical protein